MKFSYVLDFDTMEELTTGEIEADSAEEAREKILSLVNISVIADSHLSPENVDNVTNQVLEVLINHKLVPAFDADRAPNDPDNEKHELIYDSVHDSLKDLELVE